jgi:hypothetical protein
MTPLIILWVGTSVGGAIYLTYDKYFVRPAKMCAEMRLDRPVTNAACRAMFGLRAAPDTGD